MENKSILIKELVEDFLKKLTVDFDDVSIEEENGNIRLAIKTSDSGVLIGSEGNNIKALNYLIKQVSRRHKDDEVKNINFYVDVNDYQAKNIERLKNLATEAAKKSTVFKRDIEMEPMSSFERLIIHSALSDYPNIKTESAGEIPFRRIVIKFIDTESINL